MLHSIAHRMALAIALAAAAAYAGRVFTQVPVDVTAPAVEISSPTVDEMVSGLVTVTATASDDVGMAGVQFVLNGYPLGAEDTTEPFSVTWDTTAGSLGAHVLSAIASDEAGNIGDSALQPVIVVAAPPPPAPNVFPVATNDAITSSGGAPVTFSGIFLLANDSDGNGDPLVVTSVDSRGTAGSTIVNNSGGTWTYTPLPGFIGSDTFTYSISDGKDGGAAATVNVTVTAPPAGLVAAYGFDEEGGSIAIDVSGNGNHGTITGATRMDGRFGRALSFNGISDVVTVPDSPSLGLTTGMTIEAWVRPNVLSGWRTVALKETATGLAYALYAHDDAPRPAVTANFGGADTSATGSTALPIGAWTHLAATFDGASMRLYVNTALMRTVAVSGALITSGQPLSIGGNSVWGEYFDGLIDQVRIYNVALTAAQIAANSRTAMAPPAPMPNRPPVANGDTLSTTRDTALTIAAGALLANDTDPDTDVLGITSVESSSAAGGTITANGAGSWIYTPASGFVGDDTFGYAIADARGGSASGTVTLKVAAPASSLVGAWSFNEGAGTTVADASGGGRTGIIRDAQWNPAGRYGASLVFDGVDDWVTIADDAAFGFTTGVTIEAWVKPGVLSGWETVVIKERGAGDYSYALYAHDGGDLPAGARVPSGNVRTIDGHQTLRGASELPAGVWSHVATTYDGTTQRLFVNGVEVASRPLTGPIETGAGVLRIGGNEAWADEFFQGEIDEVRVYNRALSQPEIEADMKTPIP